MIFFFFFLIINTKYTLIITSINGFTLSIYLKYFIYKLFLKNTIILLSRLAYINKNTR